MDWLCQFQSVSQTNGKLTQDETLFFKKETANTQSLTQICKDEYDTIAVQLQSEQQEREKQDLMTSQMVVSNDIGHLPLFLTENEVQTLRR